MKKSQKPFISAVIVAAGRGTRMNMDINKQYVEVGGIPVLARTLKVFSDCSYIDEIVLVVNHDDMIYCKQNIVEFYNIRKVTKLVAGGNERQNSVYNGLTEVDGKCGIVLIHDGARPFVTENSLIESINAADEFGASCVAVPVKDTIKSADPQQFIAETFDRSTLWAIQTPQTFRYGLILEAHRRARQEGFTGTDDATLVEHLGCRIKLVMGGYYNIKITTKEDLTLAEAIAEGQE